MVEYKKKSAGDAKASASIFDVIIEYFTPTHMGSIQCLHFCVEVSLFADSKLRQLRLKLQKLFCCAVQHPIEFRP